MTYYREVPYHEIPDAWDRQTDALLDQMFADQYQQEVEREMFDVLHPGWETDEIDREDRRFIDWSDVEDADWSTVRYDLTYVPGADE